METRWSMWSTQGDVDSSQSKEGEDLCTGYRSGDDGCAYTSLRKTICSLEKDPSGKPVQKCERTEQLLRKCAGRPAEVVDSKVEATEEDASTSHHPFSLDYDTSAGRTYSTPLQRWGRRLGSDGDPASGVYPLFDRSVPEFRREFPKSLDELVGDLFGGPFGVLEEGERAAPPSTAPETAEHFFGLFKRGPFGGGGQTSPAADATSSDQSNSKQEVGGLYDALGRGVQEV